MGYGVHLPHFLVGRLDGAGVTADAKRFRRGAPIHAEDLRRLSPAAAPAVAPPVAAPPTSDPTEWGRVDDEGTVWVRTAEGERSVGSYPGADLTWWADRIREWDLAGLDVFAYFNNDGNANAVRNARTLRALLVSRDVSQPATSAVNPG